MAAMTAMTAVSAVIAEDQKRQTSKASSRLVTRGRKERSVLTTVGFER